MWERGSGMDSKDTRFFRSGLEAPHRDAYYRQKHRQWDRWILSGRVNLCSASWSMILLWNYHHLTNNSRCCHVNDTDAPSHSSYVSQRGCHTMNGGPRACSWQLFVLLVLTVFAIVFQWNASKMSALVMQQCSTHQWLHQHHTGPVESCTVISPC